MKKIIFLVIWIMLTAAATSFGADGVRFGTTFSPVQCTYLDLDWKEAYLAALELPLDVIRLGAYWSDIEQSEGVYDFSDLDWQIDQAGAHHIPVILTVGMKAPRWPEYHIPDWMTERIKPGFGSTVSRNRQLQEGVLKFVEAVVMHYRSNGNIAYWQVENEALNRFGGRHWRMHNEFLRDEIALVRELDPAKRPVILTASTYPNNFLRILSKIFTNAKPLRDTLQLADIPGINVYPVIGQRFLGRARYYRSRSRARQNYFAGIYQQAREQNKDIWVTELQAEPWEAGHLAYRGADTPPTGDPQAMRQTLQELYDLGYRTFLLWGVEYWYYRKTEHGNAVWWDTVKDVIRTYKSETGSKD